MNNHNKIKFKGHMKFYLKWPLLLGLFLLLASIGVIYMDYRAGIVSFISVCIYLIIAIVLYRYNSPRILKELVDFASEYNQIQRQMMHGLSVPYALLDANGKLLWINEEMEKVLQKDNLRNRSISSFFPNIKINEVVSPQEIYKFYFQYNSRYYRAEIKKFLINDVYDSTQIVERPENEEYLIAAYLFDETDIRRLMKENKDQRLVAGLIDIDNYDEAMESIEEVRQSLLAAMIDRAVNKYFASIDGVVKKLEKDKYFVIFKYEYLSYVEENKFSLLDEVKAVNLGNQMAVTVSIGLGYGADTYARNCEYSRMAIDMALGRGGDQAVIKNGDKVYYFGGKTKSVEKQTRVKARVRAHALRELLLTKDNVLIMGHKLGDVDSFGASIGIYRAIKSMNKNAQIVINDITASMRPMYERFTKADGYEEDLFVRSEKALELLNENTVVIVVDVNRPSYTECPELIEKGNCVVVLDHHRRNTETIQNAVLSYIEPYSSSACEMVSEILQYIVDKVVLKQQEVDALYAGIMIDTNNFTNRTGVRTFEAAAFLRRRGADVTRVRMMLRDDMADFKAKAKAIQEAEVFMENYAITECEAQDLLSPTVVGAQAANELLNIKGIKASFVTTQYNGQIYISARSIDTINVQLIMERLGGGGHSNIAGAQIVDSTVEEVKQLIKDTISQMVKDGDL